MKRYVFRTAVFEYPLIELSSFCLVKAELKDIRGFPYYWVAGRTHDEFWPRPDPGLKGDLIEVFDDDGEMPR